MADFPPPKKKMPLQFHLGQGSSRDSAGEAHTASGALAFGSPNFKMLPEPLTQTLLKRWHMNE